MHIVYAGLRQGPFSGARDWGSNVIGSLLLLTDNYNHTTNDPTTETQSARRTHRDFSQAIPEGRSLLIITGYRKQRRAAAGPRSAPLGSRLPLVAVACGPSLGGDGVGAGWLV
jgi:hypothetical protein